MLEGQSEPRSLPIVHSRTNTFNFSTERPPCRALGEGASLAATPTERRRERHPRPPPLVQGVHTATGLCPSPPAHLPALHAWFRTPGSCQHTVPLQPHRALAYLHPRSPAPSRAAALSARVPVRPSADAAAGSSRVPADAAADSSSAPGGPLKNSHHGDPHARPDVGGTFFPAARKIFLDIACR